MNALLAELAAVYAEHGLDAAVHEYRQRCRGHLRMRTLSVAVEAVLPLSRLLSEVLFYDEAIGRHGVGAGSRLALDRWGLTPRYELTGAAWRALTHGPFVAFGNHVTGVEAAFFNSLFVRSDIAHLAGTFIGKVGPNLNHLVLPVHNTAERNQYQPASRRGRTLLAIESLIWPPRDDFTAKRDNLTTLRRGADLVVTGRGGVHLFPTGSMDHQAPWQPGIGHLVKQMLRLAGAQHVQLVPLVYGISDAHLMASRLFGHHPVRLIGRALLGPAAGHPYVYAPDPISLGDAGFDAYTAPERIAQLLHDRWIAAQAQAEAALPRWPASRHLLRSGPPAPSAVAPAPTGAASQRTGLVARRSRVGGQPR